MSKKQKNFKSGTISSKNIRQTKPTSETQPDFYHKHKNTFWTVVVIIILAIFFIMNNTRKVPESGPYPPNYQQEHTSE
jgi:uncharacterized integral membrane protein